MVSHRLRSPCWSSAAHRDAHRGASTAQGAEVVADPALVALCISRRQNAWSWRPRCVRSEVPALADRVDLSALQRRRRPRCCRADQATGILKDSRAAVTAVLQKPSGSKSRRASAASSRLFLKHIVGRDGGRMMEDCGAPSKEMGPCRHASFPALLATAQVEQGSVDRHS